MNDLPLRKLNGGNKICLPPRKKEVILIIHSITCGIYSILFNDVVIGIRERAKDELLMAGGNSLWIHFLFFYLCRLFSFVPASWLCINCRKYTTMLMHSVNNVKNFQSTFQHIWLCSKFENHCSAQGRINEIFLQIIKTFNCIIYEIYSFFTSFLFILLVWCTSFLLLFLHPRPSMHPISKLFNEWRFLPWVAAPGWCCYYHCYLRL